MALFVYVTDQCREDARSHGILADLEAFRGQVEERQSTSQFDPFPPPYMVKKKLGSRQGRLIAELREVGEHSAVVFLAVLIRGEHAYQEGFAVDPIGYGQQHFVGLAPQDILARFIDDRTRATPPPAKPEPSEAEYSFLYEAFAHQAQGSADELVCETEEWVAQVRQERIAKQLALLCRPCAAALYGPPGLHFEPVPEKQGWGIWALRTERRMLLLTLTTESNAVHAETFSRRLAEQLAGKDGSTILRASRRAYPALILADDELWIDLEQESEANMALSPEESEVLESARRSESPFPLFINGRAGSGKSTILQYLFADLLFYHTTRPEGAHTEPPIYLTANPELLRVARTFVERLLRTDATLAQQAGSGSPASHREFLGEAFREFQPFVLSLVPAAERLRRFAQPARVDYARFRRLWTEKFGRDRRALRDFGPALSWHVIRSYIKGMNSEAFLDPDDYAQLPENQLSVTREAFSLVHDRVWEAWYQPRLEADRLWDDQDLTRHVLEADLAQPLYPAVFCDEAQDFTRLELELLLRLNVFSHRQVPPSDIRRVPFAFAGDQFQTLNPTGFRWDAVKAAFVEKFVFALDPSRRAGRVDLNYRELEYNYRSTPQIVRFGNHVQAARSALFQIPGLRPQVPWATQGHSFPVAYFQSDDARFWKKFRDNPVFVVLVPCAEGEEAEFVQQDPVLREHIRVDDDVPVNVLSAGRAKGCEYPTVILYGFGAAAEVDVVAAIEGDSTEALLHPDRSLPLQYFINRLYVAVSRPKQRLIVVDTQNGFKRLWKCAQDERAERVMLSRIKNGDEVWGGQIEGMHIGNADDVTREIAGDPIENARAYENEGIARRDSFLMKQAAQAYRSGGETAKAKECRAMALEFDGAFLDAGESYVDAGLPIPDGLRCLWLAGRPGWSRLGELQGAVPAIRQETEYHCATVILAKPGPDGVADVLEKLAERLKSAEFANRCIGEPAWQTALEALLEPLAALERNVMTQAQCGRIARALEAMRVAGLAIPGKGSAPIYYRAKRYRDAVDLWESAGDTRSREYDRAKASVEPYPGRILPLARLQLFSEVAESYAAAPDVPLTPEQADAVAEALAEVGRHEEALTLAWTHGSPASAGRLLVVALKRRDDGLALQAIHVAIHLLVAQGTWEPLAALASSGTFQPSNEWKEPQAQKLVAREVSLLRVALVRELGRSEKILEVGSGTQKRLSEFLRRTLKLKEGRLPPPLTVAEAGAAFERLGRFTDALAFYEDVDLGKFGDDDRRFARERWVVSKRRQAEHERSQGADLKAEDIEREIRGAIAQWRVRDADKLERFPALPPMAIPAAPVTPQPAGGPSRATSGPPPPPTTEVTFTDPVVLTAGALRFEVSRKHRRCNITEATAMATAFVKFDDRVCGGEVKFTPQGPDAWHCEAWDVSLTLGREGEVLIGLGKLGTTVRVRL
jgi:tetratricopeptide (TPR) repeat protein